jgi:hypothetical protein
VIVFVALIFGPLTHASERGRPAMALLLIGAWAGARVIEGVLAMVVKRRRAAPAHRAPGAPSASRGDRLVTNALH